MDAIEPLIYEGPRTVNGLREFLKLPPVQENSIALDETKIDQPDTIHDNILVYNFNTEWCGYSRKFQPIWEDFSNNVKDNMNIQAIDVKCDNDQNKDLCNKYKIQGYPTVIIVKNNQPHEYSGNRTVDDLISTINNL